MTICFFCHKETTDPETVTCAGKYAFRFPDGSILPAIPYSAKGTDKNDRCSDCNVKHGGYHHAGCNTERCPKCGGRLLRCGCLEDRKEPKKLASKKDIIRGRLVFDILKQNLPKSELNKIYAVAYYLSVENGSLAPEARLKKIDHWKTIFVGWMNYTFHKIGKAILVFTSRLYPGRKRS